MLVEHLIAKNSMNPKLQDIAVRLGHLNTGALLELVEFIRSGETVLSEAETKRVADEAAAAEAAVATPAPEAPKQPEEETTEEATTTESSEGESGD